MTWGSQNTETEAHAQLDRATDAGINFIDTAEMYPTTPGTAENLGDSERMLGSWLKARGNRSDLIIASKITGKGAARVRDGAPITGASIREAIEGNLKRLQTDYIDLYQLHWANRGSYHMRQNWTYDPTSQPKGEMEAHAVELLESLHALRNEGKIREFGLSNETVWGTAQFLKAADAHNLPRPVSMQNEYSLLCRHFDLDFAELSHHEDVDLLAWSPLAAGLLSAKYIDGDRPEGSRGAMQPDLNKRMTTQSQAAVRAYAELARNHNLEPAQMALAFCASRPFTGSVIIGATDLSQLEVNLAAADLVLTQDVLDGIQEVRRQYPTPM